MLVVCVAGLQEKSGIATSPVPEQQKVFLLTTSSPPFCGTLGTFPNILQLFSQPDEMFDEMKSNFSHLAHHILLTLEVSPLDKSAEVEVTLTNWSQGTEHRFRL